MAFSVLRCKPVLPKNSAEGVWRIEPQGFWVFLSFVTTQLQFFLVAVAGWMNRHQQAVIEFLQEENRVLLEQLGGKPKRFTDTQRMLWRHPRAA